MTFREFFIETDRILNLMPIYYLNLKRFKLSCGYFEPTQSITKLYDELHQNNGDENNEEYYCLFQNYENILFRVCGWARLRVGVGVGTVFFY